MTVGIYGIFDSDTDKCLYVGQSQNIEKRWKEHLKHLKYKIHKRTDFNEWYHDRGATPDLLCFLLLEECENDSKIKNTLELKWFNKLSPCFYGVKPSIKNQYEHSEETKQKIAESLRKEPKKQCNICSVVIKTNSTSCLKCLKSCSICVFDLRYKKLLVKMYVEDNFSVREISRKISVSPRKITEALKRYNIEIKKRTFDGHTHHTEAIEKITEASQQRANIQKERRPCCQAEGCFNLVKRRANKFCSNDCYYTKNQ